MGREKAEHPFRGCGASRGLGCSASVLARRAGKIWSLCRSNAASISMINKKMTVMILQSVYIVWIVSASLKKAVIMAPCN
jgi:hypothetical protein